MANTSIRIKKSSTPGISPVALANGEIAINTSDGKLFYSNPSNVIKFIENQLTFGTLNVDSQLVQATTPTDTLSIVSGTNIAIVTDTINKKITINGLDSGNSVSVTVNTNAVITSTQFTTASTSEVTVDSFATSSFRSAKYEVQLTSGSNYHVIELRTVHNGANVWMAQYGEMYTNTSLGNFDSSISGGQLNLLLTPTNAITTVKVHRSALTV